MIRRFSHEKAAQAEAARYRKAGYGTSVEAVEIGRKLFYNVSIIRPAKAVASKYGELRTPVEKALAVFLLSPETRAWLDANDPKAVEQAERALLGRETPGDGVAVPPVPACSDDEARRFGGGR